MSRGPRRAITVDRDPFMPARHRFPMNVAMPPASDEPPSHRRPFVLRGVAPRPTTGPGAVARAKHRTPATQRKIEEKTGLDNKMVDDSYTVPDD
ncbi:MAG: hypothetical protein ACRDRS_15520 [Pseudonocardiaceae bacterium]